MAQESDAAGKDGSLAASVENAESLLSAANDAAGSLKTLFFSYVTALTYAVISVAGVTDDQLFKQTPLSLPILDVDIPLVQYFAILPLVVVLVHLQLLLQSALLSNKVNEFHYEARKLDQDEQEDLRLRLEDFMLPRLLAGNHGAILRCLLFLLIYTALVVLPLFTLLLIQAQFLAFHSESMMWWHRILVTIDAIALLYFWPNLFHRKDIRARAWLKLLAFRVFPRMLLMMIILSGTSVVLADRGASATVILLVLALGLAACIAGSVSARSLFNLDSKNNLDRKKWRHCVGIFEQCSRYLTRTLGLAIFLSIFGALAVVGWRAWLGAAGPDIKIPILTLAALVAALLLIEGSRWSELRVSIFRRRMAWLDRCHDQSRKNDAPGMTVFGVQCVLGLMVSWLLLSVPSADETPIDLAQVCGELPEAESDSTAFDRASDFEEEEAGARSRLLSRVFISLAPNIVGASYPIGDTGSSRSELCVDLWYTLLANDGVLRDATVLDVVVGSLGLSRFLMIEEQAARTESEESHDADLVAEAAATDADTSAATAVDLRGRDLQWTGLQGISLPGVKGDSANLGNAVLDRASLPNASLDKVNLRQASLEDATLTGASLRSALLQEAHLDRADLREAQLDSAQLQSSSLRGSILDQAVLDWADLTDTYLVRASMRGVSADSANFDGTSFLNSILQGSLLDSSTFYGSSFVNTDARGASFLGAELQGVMIVRSQLYGTRFDGAAMHGVLISGARLWGASFADASLEGAFIRGVELQGADLATATLDLAVIVDPKVGMLSGIDANLVPGISVLGESYRDVRDQFIERTKAHAPTAWPDLSAATKCILITTPFADARPYPRCRFTVVRGGKMNSATPSFAVLSPHRSNELRVFWAEFGAHQARMLCAAPESSHRLPSAFARGLGTTFSFFHYNKAITSAIMESAVPILSNGDCRRRWPRVAIELELRNARRLTGRDPEEQSNVNFYQHWLDALSKIESEEESAEDTGQ